MPEFARLAQDFHSIMYTSNDRNVNSDYFEMLTHFFHSERLAEMRRTVTPLALYMDESTDISTTAHMLLCATFIEEQFKFQDELVDIFDVSEDGATVGAALEGCVGKALAQNHLCELVNTSHMDGASNVNDYPHRGYINSYTAIQKKRYAELDRTLVSWWCLAHRYNLALGDVLKQQLCVSLVKFIRTLVSYTHISSHTGRLSGVSANFQKFIHELSKLAQTIDKQILELKQSDVDFQTQFSAKTAG